jgi:hypothetical protein
MTQVGGCQSRRMLVNGKLIARSNLDVDSLGT